MSNDTSDQANDGRISANNRGCAVAMAFLNTAVMGLLVCTFATGPFSSTEQEIWYRYGSIAFLIFGAILPAAAMVLGARRCPLLIGAMTVWMLAAWPPFLGYLLMSGGGM